MNKPAKSPLDVFATLDQLKNYTQFDSVRITPDGSIEVTYSGKSAKSNATESVKTVTAIDSLRVAPPNFPFKVVA